MLRRPSDNNLIMSAPTSSMPDNEITNRLIVQRACIGAVGGAAIGGLFVFTWPAVLIGGGVLAAAYVGIDAVTVHCDGNLKRWEPGAYSSSVAKI